MALFLYYAPMSSASPIVWAVTELGLEYQAIEVDLKSNTHKQPEFLALNPMGQVPVLDDGGQAMFESSAITIYLGEKYGVSRDLWPAIGSPEHMVALTWIAWHAVTLGATLRQIFASSDKLGSPPEMHNAAMCARGEARFAELLAIFDGHLAGREYVTGAKFTLADAYAAAVLGWGTRVVGFDLARTPNVAAYVKRCMSRPAANAMNS